MDTLARTYGNWLATFDWNYWVTLTTRYPMPKATLVKNYDAWISALESAGQGRVDYVRAIETNAAGDWHVHALLRTPPRRPLLHREGLDVMSPRHLDRKWKHGLTDVKVYDPMRGAVWYLTKHYPDTGDGFGYAERLPLVASGCLSEP